MKWIRRGLIALVLVGGIPVAIGSLLSVEHSASVDRLVPAAPERVWEAVTDLHGMPTWRTGLDSVEVFVEIAGGQRWREHAATGSITLAVTVWQPPTRLVTRIVDEGSPFGGTWTYRLSAEGSETRIGLTEDGEVYSPFFRFVSRFVLGHERTMTTYLDDLERKLGTMSR